MNKTRLILAVIIFALGAIIFLIPVRAAEGINALTTLAANKPQIRTAERTCVVDKDLFRVTYTYGGVASVPLTSPPGEPHYWAEITVSHFKDGKWVQVGPEFPGQYVEKGCFEDVPENLVAEAKRLAAAPVERVPGKVDERVDLNAGDYRFTVSPFASLRVHEFDDRNGKLGAGLAVGYALNKYFTIEAEALGEEYRSAAVDSLEEAGANFKGYLLTGAIAPYGLLGYTRNLQIDENRMNAGAGIELRYKQVYAFADGRWTHNFGTVSPVSAGHALFRLGGGVRF